MDSILPRLDELDGGVASLPSGLVLVIRRTVMMLPSRGQTTAAPTAGLNRRSAPQSLCVGRGGGAPRQPNVDTLGRLAHGS